MRSARKAFIESESSERIKRALTHNVRSNTEAIFEKGLKYSTRGMTRRDGMDQQLLSVKKEKL